MEKIAFIWGETFVYWSPIIMVLGAAAAMAVYAGFYLIRNGNSIGVAFSSWLTVVLSFPLSRIIHWYCHTSAYENFIVAMTDYTTGGFALLGVFAAAILSALLCKIFRISGNLPRMLDCMALGGGVGIALGRLASLFNSSDRGMILSGEVGWPFAYATTNAVSGAIENRLATFMIQSILTGAIVAGLIVYVILKAVRKQKIQDGDLFMLFSMFYGACQIICDSTRYDQLFFRSNGFVSIVQIMSMGLLLLPLFLFSIRMVKGNGFRFWYLAIWLAILGLLGLAGYMEYYVQRHGTEAVFAYSVMGISLAAVCILGLTTYNIQSYPKNPH